VTGVCCRQFLPVSVLWRVPRDNLYMNYTYIADSLVNGLQPEKRHINIFHHLCPGRASGEALFAKIRKVSESLDATIYPIDRNATKYAE
jgi:V-type H+-transporting ATPase subunit a